MFQRLSYVWLAGMALVGLSLAACGSAATPTAPYETVRAAQLQLGDPVPTPTGEAVLTLRGAISVKNAGDTLALDLATLEKIGLVKYTTFDPWVDAKNTYTGVLVADLLKFSGAAPTAQTLVFTALDDYQVEIAVADAQKWPILLATQMGGQPMAIADKGPTRIIFPYDQFPAIDQTAYKDLWAWSLKTLEVK